MWTRCTRTKRTGASCSRCRSFSGRPSSASATTSAFLRVNSGRRRNELEIQRLAQAKKPSKETALADIQKRRSEKAKNQGGQQDKPKTEAQPAAEGLGGDVLMMGSDSAGRRVRVGFGRCERAGVRLFRGRGRGRLPAAGASFGEGIGLRLTTWIGCTDTAERHREGAAVARRARTLGRPGLL